MTSNYVFDVRVYLQNSLNFILPATVIVMNVDLVKASADLKITCTSQSAVNNISTTLHGWNCISLNVTGNQSNIIEATIPITFITNYNNDPNVTKPNPWVVDPG